MDERVVTIDEADVVLIGGGVMSATLGVLLHQLDPTLKIQILEGLEKVALESSNPWNNAGTGHAALCELNYTKSKEDGSVDISKAVQINEQFEQSKQFWGYLVTKGILPSPDQFIQPVPHVSFVWGEENREFLKARYEAMKSHHFFDDMEYTDDPKVIQEWAPLLLEGRQAGEVVAATRVKAGTDVNFGQLTETLIDYLQSKDNIYLATGHDVKGLDREKDGRWKVTVKDLEAKKSLTIKTPFVFVGAGGASLPLLQKSKIKEGKGYGGFPVSGQFLVCDNQEIVEKHQAKVYGKAAVGAPPMSVPHLDTRVIDGKKSLLFGPFAGFSPKFLKTGSIFDLPLSVSLSNIVPMLVVGAKNMSLTRYLIEQCVQSPEDRLDALQEFFPDAEMEHWALATAGQRVQIIKADEKEKGILQFGTETIVSEDCSFAALLGASPGASTTVSIMLNLIEKAFADRIDEWKPKLTKMVSSYGVVLADEEPAYRKAREEANDLLAIS